MLRSFWCVLSRKSEWLVCISVSDQHIGYKTKRTKGQTTIYTTLKAKSMAAWCKMQVWNQRAEYFKRNRPGRCHNKISLNVSTTLLISPNALRHQSINQHVCIVNNLADPDISDWIWRIVFRYWWTCSCVEYACDNYALHYNCIRIK
jgi:hypothetical protein